jgi:hypothetical protein
MSDINPYLKCYQLPQRFLNSFALNKVREENEYRLEEARDRCRKKHFCLISGEKNAFSEPDLFGRIPVLTSLAKGERTVCRLGRERIIFNLEKNIELRVSCNSYKY